MSLSPTCTLRALAATSYTHRDRYIIPAQARYLTSLLALLHSSPVPIYIFICSCCLGYCNPLLARVKVPVYCLGLCFVALALGTLVLRLAPWLSTKPFPSFGHEQYRVIMLLKNIAIKRAHMSSIIGFISYFGPGVE